MIEAMPVLVANSTVAPKGAPPASSQAATDEEKRICGLMGLPVESFLKAKASAQA